MDRKIKLLLDLVIGAFIPILILIYLNEAWGTVTTYVVSCLIPMAWVLVDLFYITRRFNVITAYIALTAIVRGALTFWFVDGVLYSVKDTISSILPALAFVISLMVHKPIMRYFVIQALHPETLEQDAVLGKLMDAPGVQWAVRQGCILVIISNIITSIAVFFINIVIVTAPFGTELFNQQVAYSSAITRIPLSAPEFIALGVAVWLIFRQLYALLPEEEGKAQLASDFWALVRLKESQEQRSRAPSREADDEHMMLLQTLLLRPLAETAEYAPVARSLVEAAVLGAYGLSEVAHGQERVAVLPAKKGGTPTVRE